MMGVYIKWAVLIIVLLFFITFGVKNSQPVYLNYYFNIQNLELPLYGLVFICILLGIFAGMIVGIFSRLEMRRALRSLKKEVRDLSEKVKEKEIEEKEGEAQEEAPADVLATE